MDTTHSTYFQFSHRESRRARFAGRASLGMTLAASSKSALFAGALAAAVFSCAGGARAENMRASYRVSLIGLPIGIAVASSSVENAHYKVNLNVRLTGVAALVSNLKMALASSGDYEEGAIAPSAYATTASNSRETRTLRMALDAGTVRQVQYSPQWEEDKSPEHVPLTAEHKQAILDPLSAFVMPVAPSS